MYEFCNKKLFSDTAMITLDLKQWNQLLKELNLYPNPTCQKILGYILRKNPDMVK